MCDLDFLSSFSDPELKISFLLSQIAFLEESIQFLEQSHADQIRRKEREKNFWQFLLTDLITKNSSSYEAKISALTDMYEERLASQQESYDSEIKWLKERKETELIICKNNIIIMQNQDNSIHSSARDVNAPIGQRVEMGDNSIINNSIVENAFNRITSRHEDGQEIAEALRQIKIEIENSRNEDAATNFQAFSEEMLKPEPKKPLLKSFWNGILNALPSISQLTSIVSNIEKLFT